MDEVQLGPSSGLDSGTSGTFYLDGFESRRSTYIGPLAGLPGGRSHLAALPHEAGRNPGFFARLTTRMYRALAAAFIPGLPVQPAASVLSAPPAGQTWKVYYYAPGLVAMREITAGGSVLYYLHQDHLGSTSLTTCGTATTEGGCDGIALGGEVARQLYLPYGGIRYATGTMPTDIGYTGQRADDTGLMHYGARYYSPVVGRFVSADTIVPDPANPQSLNRYSYVLNNPLKYVDPTGHRETGCDEEPTDCAGGAGNNRLDDIQQDPPDIPIPAWGDFADDGLSARDRALRELTYLDFMSNPAYYAYLWENDPDHILLKYLKSFAQYSDLRYDPSKRNLEWLIEGRMAELGNPIDLTSPAQLAGTWLLLTSAAQDHVRTWGDGTPWSRSRADCSFSDDTLVTTVNGETPIINIKIGDRVMAYDEIEGFTGIYTVTAVWAHVDAEIVLLTINGEKIETTPEHPFFTQEYGWLPAGELWVGAHVRNAEGKYGRVEAVEVVHRPQPMYNLTVAQAHTFFVGRQQWLVHNMCPDGGGRTTNAKYAMQVLGLNKQQFNRAIHDIKRQVYGNPDMEFDLSTGDVIDRRSGEVVGNLLDYLND